ncbi:MAG TPA: metallophosphoesterase [Gammaproteobacteria bacterium]|nr:metallophosphoesterase [Gammaproteobacteria bacterium]
MPEPDFCLDFNPASRGVRVLGSLGAAGIAERDIVLALNAFEKELEHGGEFTGRPTTHVLANDEHVVKLRLEYRLDALAARRWIEQALARERTLGVHHPAKTWFLLEDPGGAPPLIANITPRLQALNDGALFEGEAGLSRLLDYFIRILSQYLDAAVQHDLCLDLGLSNFGVDRQGEIYYLDDDLYAWDQFNALTNYLAIFVRAQSALTVAAAREIGRFLREKIDSSFRDSHWSAAVAEQLRGAFVPETRRAVLAALVEALYTQRAVAYRGGGRGRLLALLADVHANAPALETVLTYLDQRDVGHGILLGDVVGYGPHPAQCIDLLKDLEWMDVVCGNHDYAVVQGGASSGMSALAAWGIDWTVGQLDAERKAWLAGLPLYLNDEQWLAVHGAPRDKTFFNAYVYHMTYRDNLDELAARDIRFCFHGHTHMPKVYLRRDGVDEESDDARQSMTDYHHALVCPGSVGQARNGTVAAQFALLDTETWEIEFHTLGYAADSVVADMRSLHFPAQLIERTEQGR